ncbi:MAG TPA: 16S rRNA (adenine(1518)-N(6)/adenine(1519)-N(6))-dimethyltransferase RsmA [Candidatus Paceibacterota bacterium]|nr:16S rRNA (adenine(1518)-N(6)/adenine(1519)-N(6))-dimethyltransferase RsmA [Candidatus Paceibacterota bacterium]
MMKQKDMIFFKTKQSLGQNFLMHARIAERIALVADLTPDTVVFEIGPGTGMLTKELLKRAGKVIALEADHELVRQLHLRFAPEIKDGRLELHSGDIRTFAIATLPKGYVVVANIPYYLTGEIFRMFLETEQQPSAMTLLVQKEVAERIARTKKESILSLSIKVYGTPKYEFTVPRGAFNPAPNVDSAVLTIRAISRNNFASRAEERHFFELIRAGFAHKRKFVRKNLIEAGFSAGTIPEKARAEDLALSEWLAIIAGKNQPPE